MALNYQELQKRLIAFLSERVHSGEMTERGLARTTGVSQPHIHNVLKGKRLFSMEMADIILWRLHLDVLDLLSPEDLVEWQRRHPTP